jgi:hypothetical protein
MNVIFSRDRNESKSVFVRIKIQRGTDKIGCVGVSDAPNAQFQTYTHTHSHTPHPHPW